MSIYAAADYELGEVAAPDQSVTDLFDTNDTNQFFDQWLQATSQGDTNLLTTETKDPLAEQSSEMYIGSFPGSECEIIFEGVLNFDGYSSGNISSPEGKLVLAKRGRLESDIKVGMAVIGGCVTGNITATECVVLESESRVTGQIRTPALSVRWGAVFDGVCLVLAPAYPLDADELASEKQSDELEHFALAVAV
jgi:cytoskeletal protein CcmA (bactofilin family)